MKTSDEPTVPEDPSDILQNERAEIGDLSVAIYRHRNGQCGMYLRRSGVVYLETSVSFPPGALRQLGALIAKVEGPAETTDPEEGIDPAAVFAERFQELARAWRADQRTNCSSNMSTIVGSSHYRAIVAMGRPAVPLILAELAARPDHWAVALSTITGENPIPPEAAGNLKKIAQAWLEWGREHGLYDAKDPR